MPWSSWSSWSSWVLFGCPGASLGCLGCLGLPAAFLGLSWRSPGTRLVHSRAVVVQVPLVVVVVVAPVVVVVVVVAVGRTRSCWSGRWFGCRWLLIGFGRLGVPWLIEVEGFTSCWSYASGGGWDLFISRFRSETSLCCLQSLVRYIY